MDRSSTGRTGEAAVSRELETRGFAILARNARVGRLELDVVARRGSLLVFCEVKTAACSAAIEPFERLGRAQQQRVRKAAAGWLRANPQRGVIELRFDAAFVLLEEEATAAADVAYYEGAF